MSSQRFTSAWDATPSGLAPMAVEVETELEKALASKLTRVKFVKGAARTPIILPVHCFSSSHRAVKLIRPKPMPLRKIIRSLI